jgi:hypothetical protein
MNNKELIKKLRDSKVAEPDTAWLKRNREILLSQIKAQQSQPVEVFSKDGAKFTWQAFQLFVPLRLVYRTVAAVVLIFVLALGTSVTTVWADRSLPGDVLYSWKLTTEKVQLTLTTDKEAKTKLNVEFAGKRIQEVQQLREQSDQPVGEQVENIKKTLESYTKNIEAASGNLEDLKNTKSANAVKVASLVNQQFEQYSEALKQDKAATTEVIDEATIDEAISASEEASNKAIDIIITQQQSDSTAVTAEEVQNLVNNRISKVKAEIEALDQRIDEVGVTLKREADEDNPNQVLEQANIKTEAAKENLTQAEELLKSGDVVGSLQKVKEINEIVRETNAEVQAEIPPLVQKDDETIKGGVVEGAPVEEEGSNSNLNNQ